MKKLYPLALILTLFIVSCTHLSPSVIAGTWNLTRTIKTDLLSNPQDEESIIGAFYTEQTISYTFSPNGRYKKNMEQHFTGIEYLDPANTLPKEAETQLAAINNAFIIEGKFFITQGNIHFLPKTVTFADGNLYPFTDVCKQDKTFSFNAQPLRYSLHPQTLYLEDESSRLAHFQKHSE